MSRGEEAASMSGKRKAAILLVLLGDDVATDVFKNLPELELRQITQEIADLDYVSPELAAKVLQEYHQLSMTQDYLAQGGAEYANKLLVKAFGQDGARELIEEVTRAQELSVQNLDTLQKTDPQQLAKFIQGEHPQTIALVLAHLNSKAARAVLMLLPEKVRGKAVKRLAQMQQFSPEMVKKISVVLHRRLVAIGQQSRRAYGGVKAVADLLNQIDSEAGGAILETIEQDNAQLATSIRNLMFTFEDFREVPEPGMRELLGQLDKKTLAFADFAGNRQYITTGNLAENDRAYLFLMDYAHRRRVKIWGRARVVEDAETVAKVMPKGKDMATIVKSDVVIPAMMSNWGCYGIEACLAYLLKKPQLIHSPEMEKRIVQACLDAGGLEAMYCTTEFLVDGLDGETSMACMQFLSNIVRKNLEPPDAGLTH